VTVSLQLQQPNGTRLQRTVVIPCRGLDQPQTGDTKTPCGEIGEELFAYDLKTNPDQAGAGRLSFTRVARPDVAAVPGPVPLLGAAACFGYSRRLKKRINGRVPSKTSQSGTNGP
jgi:hypothetical protein